MRSVIIDVVDYEHDEFDMGIWHLRLPSFPHVLLATNWSPEDGRLFVGKRVSGIIYVAFCDAKCVQRAEPGITIIRPGGHLAPTNVCVRGELVDYYKTSGMPLCHVLQSIVPVYALVDSGITGRNMNIGEWIEASGNVAFNFED